MFECTWLTLPAGIMWALTRDSKLTQAVLADPRAYEGVEQRIDNHIGAHAEDVGFFFDDANRVWFDLREHVADQKIRMEGQLLEVRNGHRAAFEAYRPNAPIPPEVGGGLILLNEWDGFPETVLGSQDYEQQFGNYPFHGQYWKRPLLFADDVWTSYPPISGMAAAIHTPLDPLDKHHWSLAMALGWLAAWLAVPPIDLQRARTIVRLLSPGTSNVRDVCFHAGIEYPTDAFECIASAAANDLLVATGVPFRSTTGTRENISYLTWHPSDGPSVRDVGEALILCCGSVSLYRDVLLPAYDVRQLWPIHEGMAIAEQRQRTERGSRTGRRRNPLWLPCENEALSLLADRGPPSPDDEDEGWRTQADFERWILRWWVANLPPNGNPPAQSTIRKQARTWLDMQVVGQ